ncbi:IS66 family insertion sequence element accessory protein TnpB [uncultured Photobacterium sp.]|uniref:IS66 family insertion sequence element accessory protein TnpB n=1 Tax=uncultured Photobacterium sp. TaxID=173973 RepID=UPI002615433C|nr:IS66 family insertion sequence element accessory protein TnpB [uncultured Photobacterium sp.]
MIHLTADTKILLATKPADFRCGIDGFTALCRHQLKQAPRSGTLFVFTNRLSKGRFQDWPRHHQDVVAPLAAKQLKTLLTGRSGWQRL